MMAEHSCTIWYTTICRPECAILRHCQHLTMHCRRAELLLTSRFSILRCLEVTIHSCSNFWPMSIYPWKLAVFEIFDISMDSDQHTCSEYCGTGGFLKFGSKNSEKRRYIPLLYWLGVSLPRWPPYMMFTKDPPWSSVLNLPISSNIYAK